MDSEKNGSYSYARPRRCASTPRRNNFGSPSNGCRAGGMSCWARCSGRQDGVADQAVESPFPITRSAPPSATTARTSTGSGSTGPRMIIPGFSVTLLKSKSFRLTANRAAPRTASCGLMPTKRLSGSSQTAPARDWRPGRPRGNIEGCHSRAPSTAAADVCGIGVVEGRVTAIERLAARQVAPCRARARPRGNGHRRAKVDAGDRRARAARVTVGSSACERWVDVTTAKTWVCWPPRTIRIAHTATMGTSRTTRRMCRQVGKCSSAPPEYRQRAAERQRVPPRPGVAVDHNLIPRRPR
jgi:hypothetical protein